jgi:hypothetical protein
MSSLHNLRILKLIYRTLTQIYLIYSTHQQSLQFSAEQLDEHLLVRSEFISLKESFD